jgi:hypothetical protein
MKSRPSRRCQSDASRQDLRPWDSIFSGPCSFDMSTITPEPRRELTLHDLYPQLTDTELQDAARRLDQYLSIAFRIWSRIEADPQALAGVEALTACESHPTIETKRSPLNKPTST